MDLISCNHCGTVFDKDKLFFPTDLYTEEGSIDPTKAVWYNRDYVAKLTCPVCQEDLLETS